MTIGIDILAYLGIFFGLYFSIFILGTFWENKEKVYKKPQSSRLPSISLIVPCYNEEKNIGKTIASLLLLDYPKDKLEIIVVDDGSTDNTFYRAKAFEKYGIKVFHKPNGGKHTALNLGIENTRAELVACLDADSQPHPQSLKRIVKCFGDPKVMAAISTVKISRAKNIIEGVQYVEFLIAAFLKKIYSVLDSVFVTPGPLSVVRREAFKKIGAYRKGHQTEDLEFGFRLQRANYKIVHALDSIVYTAPCPTFASLLRQRLRWRRGLILNLKDYPDLLNFRRHGNLAFLLFYNLLGSFLSVGILSYAVWQLADFILQKTNNLFLIGVHLPRLSASFSFFSVNLKPTIILGAVSIAVFMFYLVFSRRLTADSKPIKKDTLSYILLYTFLNALFWISAIFSALFKKDVYWK